MSTPPGEVWWGREAESRGQPTMVDGPGPAGIEPELLPATAEKRCGRPGGRIADFTPDWTNPAPDDSGVALVRLFGIQMEPLLSRVNRLPEKALVEHLRIAGVTPLPATAAEALLTFTIAPAAGASVLVPAGFQAGASPATGNGGQVIFETERAVVATPATVAATAVTVAGLVSAVDPALGGFHAFGPAPRPGQALWVGLAVSAGSGQPGPIAIARDGGRGHGRRAATRHGRGNGAPARPRGPAGELGGPGRRHPGPRRPAPGRDRRAAQRRHRRAGRTRPLEPGPPARLGGPARTVLAAGRP